LFSAIFNRASYNLTILVLAYLLLLHLFLSFTASEALGPSDTLSISIAYPLFIDTFAEEKTYFLSFDFWKFVANHLLAVYFTKARSVDNWRYLQQV